MDDIAPLTEDEFRRLCDFLYRRTGMIFTEEKRYYVDHRVHDRVAATGTGTFTNYFAHLRGNSRGEIAQFINAFTVNETYFFREQHQLQCLTANLLPERTAAKLPGAPIRIWSVPCSTGEEPYSIAIWLLEHWPEVDTYNIEIVGSDIDTSALDAARTGIFGKRALMRLSPHLVDKYFRSVGSGLWQVLDDLRQSINFTAANVVEPNDTTAHGKFDIIFCRNVLIYFDDKARRIAAENLYENLLPGGYICLGHAESMSRISPLFEVRQFANAIVYCRSANEKHG